jgi:hypothetical protein
MRKWIDIVGITLVAGACIASPRAVPLYIAAVPTNAAATVSAAVATRPVGSIGYLSGVYLDFGGYATPTCKVDLVASGAMGSITRTLLTLSSATADGEYYPREIADTTAGVEITGESVTIPLLADDVLQLRAYSANVTNVITLKAWVYLTDQP